MEHDRTLEMQNSGSARATRGSLFLLYRAATDKSSGELFGATRLRDEEKKVNTEIYTLRPDNSLR